MIQFRYLFILLSLSLLANCAAPSLKPPNATQLALWQTHQATLTPINSWRITGRIAIQTDNDNWTANTYWHQNKAEYQLRFNTPTGQGALLLQGDAQQVTLRTAENETYTAQNPDELMEEVTHLPIPVTSLHDWIRGLPSTALVANEYELDEAGRLYQLRQTDWTIRYERYEVFEGVTLPSKMTLTNNQFTVKIVISQWVLQKAQTTTAFSL
ncbi:lipoprotein insertase outer membrane protein LolB [Beggiatoa leptomitoformis]|uniref:Outer-membrane lipoprotein LolB n=1 Tax=Beggiatoa leptomitoformis TaxID=288004 RepID=A0A2N9YIN2_9GAMM|nr:lipoprotein insertase outer membrane protein LolB [Beggiatoa leptomitoformis]ALG67508.1 outer membrane lipoprotein LolB [Beggiatoa leptomitoformis]AUI70269.1 outer membrane lipoprotein LolB [Beggiatoa leptomitoformis]